MPLSIRGGALTVPIKKTEAKRFYGNNGTWEAEELVSV
jgi:hypothetical protein